MLRVNVGKGKLGRYGRKVRQSILEGYLELSVSVCWGEYRHGKANKEVKPSETVVLPGPTMSTMGTASACKTRENAA